MRNRLVIIAGLVCVVCSLRFFPVPQEAQLVAPYFVTTTNNVDAGTCQPGVPIPGCSLRAAMILANEADNTDLIVFAIPASDPNCVAGVCTTTVGAELPALSASNTFINGPGADKLIIRGQNLPFPSHPVFNVVAAGTVGISGVTIRDGTNFGGGGITHSSGTLNITNCRVTNNRGFNPPSSGSGGGILNSSGTLNITNSTISNNRGGSSSGTGSGGGILNGSGGTLNVTNSTISNNDSSGDSGTGGGGIANSFGTVNITNSTISNNGATGNSATGGGIRNINGTVIVTNSTISGNTAPGSGGQGGGIFTSGGTVIVKSSVIASNTAATSGPDVIGSFDSGGFNLIGKRDGSAGFTTLLTDQTGTIAAPLNPMLDPVGPQDNGGSTRTVALLLGSPAIDKGTSNGLNGNLTTDQRGTGFPRTFDSPTIPNAAAGGDGTDIGAYERPTNATPDFDGDGKTDIGIFRPGVAEWWINRSSTGVTFATQFGATTDKIVPGDYTGDFKSDIAIWRPSSGEWFVLRSEDFSFYAFLFGTTGDIPATADYDADGKADAAVFRPSTATWFILRSTGGTTIETFGANGDVPVPGDYDGDSKADIAIFRPSVGQWWLKRSTAGMIATTFGNSSDKPVQRDYTGDGKTDIAFWRPSTGAWFVLRSENFSFFSFPFGLSTDIPAPGDYDGDGKHDATVFRPSSATWFIQRSTSGTLIQQFGATGDKPIPNALVP